MTAVEHRDGDVTTAGENPYLAARREWNERYGDYIAAAHTWRRVAMLALVIAVLSTGGAVWTGSQTGAGGRLFFH